MTPGSYFSFSNFDYLKRRTHLLPAGLQIDHSRPDNPGHGNVFLTRLANPEKFLLANIKIQKDILQINLF